MPRPLTQRRRRIRERGGAAGVLWETMDPVTPDTRIESLLANATWVRALARSLSRDDASADDLVQQTWLRVIETPPPVRSAASGWLATVVRNLARDRHRRESRRKRHEWAARPPRTEAGSAEDLLTRADAQRRLIELVVALDEPFRSTVLLRFYEGLSPAAIAQRTGVEPATVRTRLHRALALLRGRVGRDVLALAVPVTTLPGAGAGTLGGVAVGVSKKWLAAALLLLLALGGAASWMLPGDEVPTPPREEPVASAPGAPRSRLRSQPGDDGLDGATPLAAPTPAADSPGNEPAAGPARRRLDVTFLRFTGPTANPAGDDEDGKAEVGGDRGAIVMEFGGGGEDAWIPEPKRGVATWRVTVLDADGVPVEGAVVYRVELDADGRRASPCTFQWIEELGRTDAAGVRVAERQPAGDFLVAADWNSRLLTDSGLDLRHAVRAHAGTSPEPAEVTVRMPYALSRLGGVAGVVRDADGAPVRGCNVGRRYDGVSTGPDGAFEVRGLDEGDVELTFDSTGHVLRKVRTRVRAGEVTKLDVRLDDEDAGALSLAGKVVDPSGAGVAGLRVYLGSGEGEIARWTTSGDDGAFTFRRLPDSLASTGANVMANTWPERPDLSLLAPVAARVPGPPVELRVEPNAEVVLWFRDKDTGTPLRVFRADVTLERPGEEPRSVVALMQADEEGRQEVRVPRGRLVLVVAAKGYREMEIAVEVPEVPGPYDLFVEMTRE